METTDIIGAAHTITVTGQVEVLKSNEEPRLVEAAPPGINPSILILDLDVSSSGAGGAVVLWKDIPPFTKTISARQYTEVVVRNEGEDQSMTVDQILS